MFKNKPNQNEKGLSWKTSSKLFFWNFSQANEIADASINVISEASEYMQRDLEEFTKVVKEDTAAVYETVAQKTYESINQYAGEQIAKDAVDISQVNLITFGNTWEYAYALGSAWT